MHVRSTYRLGVPLFAMGLTGLVGCDGIRGTLLYLDDGTTITPPASPPPPAAAGGSPATDAGGSTPPVVPPNGGTGGCVGAGCALEDASLPPPLDGCDLCDGGTTCSADGMCIPKSECATTLADTLVCESFEDEGTYDVYERDGTVASTTAQVFDGDHALVVQTTLPFSAARISRRIDALMSGSLYFRTYMFVTPGTVSDLVKIFAFESAPPSPNVDVVIQSNYSIGAFFQTNKTAVQSQAQLLPQNRWVCLQGELTLSNTMGDMKLWLDGDKVLDTDNAFDTLPPSGIETIFFGIHWTDANEDATTLYFDDLVVDTNPIDCQ